MAMVTFLQNTLCCCAVFIGGLPIAWADSGRSEDIAIRRFPLEQAPLYSGPYPPGDPLPEANVPGGVVAGKQFIKEDYAERMRRAGFLPFRREMSNSELLAAFAEKPSSESGFFASMKRLLSNEKASLQPLDYLRKRLATYPPNLFGGGRRLNDTDIANRAEKSYEEWFTPEGKWKEKDLSWMSPPYVEMMKWAYAYKSTGDPKWARAVRDVYNHFYHMSRPPAQKIGEGASAVNSMWRTLESGAGTPPLIEAYSLIRDFPELTNEDAENFLKGMLERGQFLRYTTQPVGPWPKYDPFGYGNWLLYQLQGLLAVSVVFPDFQDSAEWIAHAHNGIETHASWLVWPDSGFSEYSYSYAGQVADQFQWCYGVFKHYGLQLSERFQQDVMRLHELFLKTAMPGNQRIPFGDTARGDSLTPHLCRWAAVAFLDGRFKYWANPPGDEDLRQAATLLHPKNPTEAVARYRALEPIPPSGTSDIVPETGWVIMRSGWDKNATVMAMAYRASEKIFHAGYETLGINLWSGSNPLLTRLQGRDGYARGYPEGFHRSARAANLVSVSGPELVRESGSLRNWFTSSELDFLDADHHGWMNGKVKVRRRVLFLKPDWLLIIDDLEGNGTATTRWQANTDTVRPSVAGDTATVTNGQATCTISFLGLQPEVESHSILGSDQSVYVLKAEKEKGLLPQRYVALIHVGAAGGEKSFGPISADGIEGVEITNKKGTQRIQWEAANKEGRRFICWNDSEENWFAADDTPSVPKRIQGSLEGIPPQIFSGAAISPDEVSGFEWAGGNEISSIGVVARIFWNAGEPAINSVLYREAGTKEWRRQLEPNLHREAWILLPDLQPDSEYEIQVVSEYPDGRIRQSPIFNRTSPKK